MSQNVQLQPETILQVTSETEERIWSQGGLTDDREESLHLNPGDIGNVILQHGGGVRQIHNYFSSLEQRKCCLLLAACKQRFCSVRLVRNDGRDSGIEEGAMMKSSLGNHDNVMCLSATEFQVFQHALRCAAFPVLGAPDPPLGITPSPGNSPPLNLQHHRLEGGSSTLFSLRSLTPHSHTDSGVEEQEDTTMVPAETLCELLRRTFKLSPEKFNQYEDLIAGQIEKKSPQKILAEELVRQLMALENNTNPFYNPKSVVNRLGYDQWQQRERIYITELLNKFWHFSLPSPSTRSVEVKVLHDQYKRLMERLIHYESPYRQQSDHIAPHPTSPLSSASVRLLKEFGLRYGVGEQYRKTVYLNYLTLNFDPTVWYIQHVTVTLTSVIENMPTKRSCLVIVKEEYTMLESSLQLLDVKTSAAVAKMKTLFSRGNKPHEGLESLIELMSLVIQSKAYLLMHPKEQLGNKLYKIIQTIFPTAYERHKMVAQDELRHNKWGVELSPKLLNMLMGHMRDEVLDYKQNYQPAFQRYFNITVEAAQEFYKLLMADVQELHRHSRDAMNSLKINKLMLSLLYRLNQLDQDWSTFITPQMQTWREIYLTEAQHWSVVLKLHMHDFITKTVAIDRYTSCELQLSGSLQQSTSHRSQRYGTISKSLTPSENSAFSSLSSAQSPSAFVPVLIHPQPPIPEGNSEDSSSRRTSEFLAFSPPCDPILPDHKDRRPNSDPVNVSHSSILSGSYLGDMARNLGHYDEDDLLSFANMRHSSSLPNMNTNARLIEMVSKQTTTFKEGKSVDRPTDHVMQTTRLDTPHGNDSPEIFNILTETLGIENSDSDDSDTLTEDSGSPADDNYSFPPVTEEVKSSTPVYNITSVPPTVLSDVAENTGSAFYRPVARVKGHSTHKFLLQNTKHDNGIQTKSKLHDQNKNNARNQSNTSSFVQGHPELKSHDHDINHHSNIYGKHPFDSFTDSLNSTYSLPGPSVLDKTVSLLPVSSSTIDVIVILQRFVGFGKALSRTLAPFRSGSETDQSKTLSSSCNEDMSNFPPSYTKCRQKMYENFLTAICSTICVYADNMLCMDLCGTSNHTASRLAGPRLVEYLQTQQRSGLVWGCRHDLTGHKNCFEFLNKKTSLLCDRHEPITRDMCTRINNVSAMLSCLDWFHRRLGNVFGILSDFSVKQQHTSLQMSINSSEMLRSDFIVVDNYGYDPVQDRSEVMETGSQLCPSLQSHSGVNILITSPIDTDRDHLMAVLRAQCRVMAYRLNLFVCDALPLLLTLKAPHVTLDVGLKPITDFLSSYIAAIQGWLYKDSYRRVLECLWIFIVQDFELELSKLERSEDDTQNRGQILLQALAHLLKFMNGQHACLRKELLLSQAEDVSFRLSLYAMPVSQLIAIYRGLVQNSTGTETSSTDSQYQSTLLVRQRLKHDLQTYKKCFSGADLTRWILENQELIANLDASLSESSSQFTRETARHIAQRLVDWTLIADVDTQSRGRSSPTYSLDEYEFPDVTIHSQMKGRPFSQNSDIYDTTPRATPRPNLKSSVRALSRQSGLKATTPGLKSQGLRSQRSNVTERSNVMERSTVSSTNERQELMTSYKDAQNKQYVCADVHVNGSTESAGNNDKPIDQNTKQDNENVNQITDIKNTVPVSGVKDELVRQDSNYSKDSLVDSLPSVDSDLSSSLKLEYQNIKSKIDSSSSQAEGRPGANFDPYLDRGTPMSMSSCDSRTTAFLDASDTFYYVCPHVGNHLETGLKNYEMFQLVEECFQKKVVPDYIIQILYCRRKEDAGAKMFIKMLPYQKIEKLKYDIKANEIPMCVSS